jgi:hypothetical protein
VKYYKVKRFAGEAKKNDVSDSMLTSIATEFVDAPENARQQYSLGAGLYKLRLASKSGAGKSGGSRSILAFKKEKMLIWLHLYSKNEKGNISHSELVDLKKLANILLNATEAQLARLVKNGGLEEIINV